MDFAKVSVEIRNQSGKGPARRARSSGKLPGVLYGHKLAPLPLVLNPVELLHALDKERKRNTVFTLQVKDAAKPQLSSEDVTAMIRDVQIDPLSRQPVHVDFVRVSMEEEINVTVPLVLTGTPVGVVNGGNLHLSHHTLPIAAKPNAIPVKVELDVTALDIGDALHASDLKLPAGVRTTLAPKESVASVVAPHIEKVEETAAAVTAEGAVPAEGAAAPAAGAAPGAAGAAPPAAGAAAGAAPGGAKAAPGGAKAAPAAGAKKEEKKGK
jgi:large subunit ribosomal protein L25